MKRILIFTFVILIPAMSLFSQDPTEITRKSQAAVKVSSFEAISTLTITDSNGNEKVRQNSLASKTFADQTEKRIIKFLSPAEVKGTGILIFDYENKNDDMWIYLPALKKTRRIVSSEKNKSFMGSEFTNADMTAPSIEDFTYTFAGVEVMAGVDCWKISALPVNKELEDNYGYANRISWIGKKDNIIRKTEYYDYDGNLMKIIETINFKQLEKSSEKYMVTEMLATNLQNGRSSRLKMDKIQISNTDENYFTVAYLER